MKKDSNSINIKIHLVCNDCGKKALKLPENTGKRQFGLSTWYTSICDVCKERKPVTQTRDFMFPVFDVEEKP